MDANDKNYCIGCGKQIDIIISDDKSMWEFECFKCGLQGTFIYNMKITDFSENSVIDEDEIEFDVEFDLDGDD